MSSLVHARRQILFHGFDRWGVTGKRKFWQPTLTVNEIFAWPSLIDGCTWMLLGREDLGCTLFDSWDVSGCGHLWRNFELNFSRLRRTFDVDEQLWEV